MGLDVIAYSGLRPASGDQKKSCRLIPNWGFPGRSEGVPEGEVFTFEVREHIISMSYSSYNEWRNRLAELAGYPGPHFDRSAWARSTGPFWELINFSDCEGILGPVVCKKLLQDFKDFEHKAAEISCNFFQDYLKWMRGIEIASKDGAIKFT